MTVFRLTFLYVHFSFKEKVNALSNLMALDKHNQTENAVRLLEHVAATDGADHLKLNSRHMNVFQFLSIDVLAFLAFTFILCFKLICLFLRAFRDITRSFYSGLSSNQKVKSL